MALRLEPIYILGLCLAGESPLVGGITMSRFGEYCGLHLGAVVASFWCFLFRSKRAFGANMLNFQNWEEKRTEGERKRGGEGKGKGRGKGSKAKQRGRGRRKAKGRDGKAISLYIPHLPIARP